MNQNLMDKMMKAGQAVHDLPVASDAAMCIIEFLEWADAGARSNEVFQEVAKAITERLENDGW